MRLTNINCPQCNGRLNQQEDKFFCTSCGSAFNVDYDESDVAYAKLVTEPERTRLLLESNRALLEKDAELRRKFLIGEMKDTVAQEAKSAAVVSLGGAFYGWIIGAIGFLAVVAFIVIICAITSKNLKAERAKSEQARQATLESFSVQDVANDRNFLENAMASGAAMELSRRDEPVENKVDDGGDAYLVGSPVAVSCYFLKDGTVNSLCIVYKVTYVFSENKSLKDVYTCVFFDDIEPDGTGHIAFGPGTCTNVSGRGSDHHWDGYETAEEASEDVLPRRFDVYEINISERG